MNSRSQSGTRDANDGINFCRFRSVRQQFIPKPNGKMRKLGIPCVRDKVVQEVMHMILEAIYDSPNAPYFQETSHGFRPLRSCHTALREVRTHWTGVNWYVEGDIRACFDELDHQVLVHTLRKKIQDERFLNLIWKLLKAGYMDLHGNKKESLIGSPQGGIISPILANVYLHFLDEYIEEVKKTYEKGSRKRDNPEYARLIWEKNRLVAQGATKTKAFKAIMKQIRATPSKMVNDSTFCRIKYLRYADDVRHLTRCLIPLGERRSSEEMTSGSLGLPGGESQRGHEHAEKAEKGVKTLKPCSARPA